MSFYVTDESQLAERHKMQSTYARPLSYHEHDVTQMNVSLLKAELKDMSSDRDVLRDELAKVTIQYTIFFFSGLFPISGRPIKFSFSVLVLLLSLLGSPSSLFL